jgi:hypothetical protein
MSWVNTWGFPMINELAAMDSHNFEWVDQQKGTIFHSHASYVSLRV